MIAISAAALACGTAGASAGETRLHPYGWRGTALGAEAWISLHHPDPAEAARLVAVCRAEIERLERIFSLYRPDSELTRLNRARRLSAPSHELTTLLSQACAYARATGGAFDPTMQPLFELYAGHFAGADSDPAGPSPSAVRRARAQVDHRAVRIGAREIAIEAPARAVSLNGIAQGFITDRIAGILRRAGLRHVLVNLGEFRGIGPRPDGDPWTVRLGRADGRPVALTDAALATSGGMGTPFEASGRHNHLIDPRTGRSPRHWDTVSVLAETATKADALSTAISMMSLFEARALVSGMAPIRVFLNGAGRQHVIDAGTGRGGFQL